MKMVIYTKAIRNNNKESCGIMIYSNGNIYEHCEWKENEKTWKGEKGLIL